MLTPMAVTQKPMARLFSNGRMNSAGERAGEHPLEMEEAERADHAVGM